MGVAVARYHHQARSVLVEAMDNPRPPGVGAAAEQVAPRVDERPAAMARSRVDDEAGGLVDHRQPLVGVDDSGPCQGADSFSSAGSRSAATASAMAPSVIAMSATLKAGHSGGSMKSVTAESRRRSMMLPIAPP